MIQGAPGHDSDCALNGRDTGFGINYDGPCDCSLSYREKKVTLSGKPADSNYSGAAPQDIDPITKQHRDHWVLSQEDRNNKRVRPLRNSYKHLFCGTITSMPGGIAETYAANPKFYSATFCCGCKQYFAVDQFVWAGTNEKVGS